MAFPISNISYYSVQKVCVFCLLLSEVSQILNGAIIWKLTPLSPLTLKCTGYLLKSSILQMYGIIPPNFLLVFAECLNFPLYNLETFFTICIHIGLPELRSKICNFHVKLDGLVHFQADNTVIGPGSKELIFLLLHIFDGGKCQVRVAWGGEG